jgi:hypothetical protein
MAEQPPSYPAQPQVGTNGLAIASFVCSLIPVMFIGTILGLVFGIAALRQIKQSGQGGRGFAIAGVVISSATIALVSVISVGLVITS